jgi:hypothetical protein
MLVTAERVAEEVFAEPAWTEEETTRLAGLLGRLGGTGFTRHTSGGS